MVGVFYLKNALKGFLANSIYLSEMIKYDYPKVDLIMLQTLRNTTQSESSYLC